MFLLHRIFITRGSRDPRETRQESDVESEVSSNETLPSPTTLADLPLRTSKDSRKNDAIRILADSRRYAKVVPELDLGGSRILLSRRIKRHASTLRTLPVHQPYFRQHRIDMPTRRTIATRIAPFPRLSLSSPDQPEIKRGREKRAPGIAIYEAGYARKAMLSFQRRQLWNTPTQRERETEREGGGTLRLRINITGSSLYFPALHPLGAHRPPLRPPTFRLRLTLLPPAPPPLPLCR